MLFAAGVLGFASLLLIAYAVLDAATTPGTDVRGLPKPLWFPVLLVPLLGAGLWFLLGRPQRDARGQAAGRPPGGTVRTQRAPDDDEAFLRDLRRRAEQQRRRAEEQRRRTEQQRDGEQQRDEDDRRA